MTTEALERSELISLAEGASHYGEDFILSELEHPRWNARTRFDWKRFVPPLFVRTWQTLPTGTKLVIFIMASEAADRSSP